MTGEKGSGCLSVIRSVLPFAPWTAAFSSAESVRHVLVEPPTSSQAPPSRAAGGPSRAESSTARASVGRRRWRRVELGYVGRCVLVRRECRRRLVGGTAVLAGRVQQVAAVGRQGYVRRRIGHIGALLVYLVRDSRRFLSWRILKINKPLACLRVTVARVDSVVVFAGATDADARVAARRLRR